VYLTVSRALNRSTTSFSVDAAGVSRRLMGTQPKYLSSQRGRNRCISQSHGSTSFLSVDATGVSHRLTGTQSKYLSSQRGCDQCISQSHGHSTEVPLLSAWTRRVYPWALHFVVTGRIGTGRAVRNREYQLDETRLGKEQIVNLSITYCKTIVN
jgi:hypothetical protein